MNYFIGIDSSTTATKALLMAADGRVMSVALSAYDYETPQPLWSEQQPELWFKHRAQLWHAYNDSLPFRVAAREQLKEFAREVSHGS